jgi:hypothetical protein
MGNRDARSRLGVPEAMRIPGAAGSSPLVETFRPFDDGERDRRGVVEILRTIERQSRRLGDEWIQASLLPSLRRNELYELQAVGYVELKRQDATTYLAVDETQRKRRARSYSESLRLKGQRAVGIPLPPAERELFVRLQEKGLAIVFAAVSAVRPLPDFLKLSAILDASRYTRRRDREALGRRIQRAAQVGRIRKGGHGIYSVGDVLRDFGGELDEAKLSRSIATNPDTPES